MAFSPSGGAALYLQPLNGFYPELILANGDKLGYYWHEFYRRNWLFCNRFRFVLRAQEVVGYAILQSRILQVVITWPRRVCMVGIQIWLKEACMEDATCQARIDMTSRQDRTSGVSADNIHLHLSSPNTPSCSGRAREVLVLYMYEPRR